MKKNIVVGISGGIAAGKIPQLISQLQEKDWNVTVIATQGATQIIDVTQLQKQTGNTVYTNLFAEKISYEEVLKKRQVEHIRIADSANIIVIAPATANVLAKIANGIADDYLTTTVLAATCPVILCPSMNVHMWTNPVTQENIKKLLDRGFYIIHPDRGMLACGYEGEGKLAKIEEIIEEIEIIQSKQDVLVGKKYIVTAGGTIEPIDSIRYITNKSSGKMGAALADQLWLLGADVLFVRSKQSVRPRYVSAEKVFETPEELELILQTEVPHYDGIFHSAAVSDFTVTETVTGKISSDSPVTLTLIPREKIITKIKTWNPTIMLYAFKAVWDMSEKELIQTAKEKLTTSYADAIIANDVGKDERGFSVDTNEVYIVTKQGKTTHLPFASKTIIAKQIVDCLFHV